MRLLLSAIACSPTLGSEAHFGWNALLAISSLAEEVHLLGHEYNRAELESAQAHGILPANVHLHFAGSIHPRGSNPILARINNWRGFTKWTHGALHVARALHRDRPFDLAHHVTVSTWRVPCPLWQLPNLPLIWGPLGGGEELPISMWPILSPGARLFEALRRLQSTLARITPSIRQCARKSTRVLASNPDTAALLQRLGTPPANLTQLSAAFFTQDQTNHFTPAQRPPGPLRLFAGGQIEGRKGISLALDALSLLHRQGIPFHYTIAGHGPEIPRLREKTKQLGLAASISFPGALRGDEYLNALQQSHAYLLPSLRDSAGLTLMEAMLCGCVPIVADCGGPGAIVTPACGFKIPVTTPEKMTHQIANALRQLANQSANPPASQAARERILSSFSETNYRTRIQSLYNEIH